MISVKYVPFLAFLAKEKVITAHSVKETELIYLLAIAQTKNMKMVFQIYVLIVDSNAINVTQPPIIVQNVLATDFLPLHVSVRTATSTTFKQKIV